eukprot:m.98486 g.98486  ORF g.98486 m.98486 type:complete len:229 (-) comp9014_c6_seq2:1488-2174(-)
MEGVEGFVFAFLRPSLWEEEEDANDDDGAVGCGSREGQLYSKGNGSSYHVPTVSKACVLGVCDMMKGKLPSSKPFFIHTAPFSNLRSNEGTVSCSLPVLQPHSPSTVSSVFQRVSCNPRKRAKQQQHQQQHQQQPHQQHQPHQPPQLPRPLVYSLDILNGLKQSPLSQERLPLNFWEMIPPKLLNVFKKESIPPSLLHHHVGDAPLIKQEMDNKQRQRKVRGKKKGRR